MSTEDARPPSLRPLLRSAEPPAAGLRRAVLEVWSHHSDMTTINPYAGWGQVGPPQVHRLVLKPTEANP